jgi:hypothetical protein
VRMGARVGENNPGLEAAECEALVGFVVEESIICRDHVWRTWNPEADGLRLVSKK